MVMNLQQTSLVKMAQALFAAGKEERPQMPLPNPHAYFRPIDDATHGMHALPHPEMYAEARVLSTPSPLLPPPSPLYAEQERAVLEELHGFLRRSGAASPFPLAHITPLSSPAMAMFQYPAAPRVSSPLNAAHASAFQRPTGN